jgi:hypothetical protein
VSRACKATMPHVTRTQHSRPTSISRGLAVCLLRTVHWSGDDEETASQVVVLASGSNEDCEVDYVELRLNQHPFSAAGIAAERIILPSAQPSVVQQLMLMAHAGQMVSKKKYRKLARTLSEVRKADISAVAALICSQAGSCQAVAHQHSYSAW